METYGTIFWWAGGTEEPYGSEGVFWCVVGQRNGGTKL